MGTFKEQDEVDVNAGNNPERMASNISKMQSKLNAIAGNQLVRQANPNPFVQIKLGFQKTTSRLKQVFRKKRIPTLTDEGIFREEKNGLLSDYQELDIEKGNGLSLNKTGVKKSKNKKSVIVGVGVPVKKNKKDKSLFRAKTGQEGLTKSKPLNIEVGVPVKEIREDERLSPAQTRKKELKKEKSLTSGSLVSWKKAPFSKSKERSNEKGEKKHGQLKELIFPQVPKNKLPEPKPRVASTSSVAARSTKKKKLPSLS